MVIQICKDTLLSKAEKAFRSLADCVVETMQLGCLPPSTCWPLEWLLLLHCRSADVLVEFSEYYCLKLLLDRESPLATYFIDLFHQLEWLLRTQLALDVGSDTPLPQWLLDKIHSLLDCIKPATDTCRLLFAICRFSPTLRSKWCPAGVEMKRKADNYREFTRDHNRIGFKMLPFTDLDQASDARIQLGKCLGEGASGVVFKGNFWAWNENDQCYRICGDPVAVKVFGAPRDSKAITGQGCGDTVAVEGDPVAVKVYGADHDTKPIGQGCLSRLKDADANFEKISCGDTNHMTETKDVQLFQELCNLLSVKHPNIVSPIGYIGKREKKGAEAGLVMELMDTSLKDFLQGVTEPLEEVVMIDLMLEIARGARFLQECGIVHGDLKSQNILLRSTNVRGCWKDSYPVAEVKLADFGLTRCIVQDARGPSAGKCIVQDARAPSAGKASTHGTYCYMAPECLSVAEFKGHPYEEKVDVFSYGTICFDILACGDPDACQFTSPGSKAKALELFYKDVKSGKWRERVKGKSEYLVDLIARCWNFDARERPTFATICSFLQHAFRCALSPPVIQECGPCYRVIGTTMLDSCLADMSRDVRDVLFNGEHKEIDLSEDVALFSEVLNHEMAFQPAAKTEDDVGVSSSKQLTTERNRMQLKPIKIEDGVCRRDTPEIVVKGNDQRFSFRVPFKIMDTEWIVFKALICSSVLSNFPFSLDKKHQITKYSGDSGRRNVDSKKTVERYTTGDMFPFFGGGCFLERILMHEIVKKFGVYSDDSSLELDKKTVERYTTGDKFPIFRDVDMDAQLIPMLVCFWEACFWEVGAP